MGFYFLKLVAVVLAVAIAMGFTSCESDSEDDVSKLLLLSSSTGSTGNSSGIFRVNRGGSSTDGAAYCTLASRGYFDTNERNYFFGFRVVRNAE